MTRSSAGVGDVATKYLPWPGLEYVYYAQVFYSIMGPAVGLQISRLGIALLGVAGLVTALKMGSRSLVLLRPAVPILACGVSYLAVQLLIHRESLDSEYVHEFVPWLASVVIVQHLAMRRGFLHRASMMVIFIALSTLPFLRAFGNDTSRAGLAGINIGNPNDLGAWFGFCCVYLTIVGLEVRRNWIRAIAWTLAIGCLFVVGLTVSRGPLFAVAATTVFAFRRALKRGFYPFMALVVVAWITYGLGLFERSAELYAARGMEESGRFTVWPLVIARFLEAPLAGVGADHAATMIPGRDLPITPHNAFLFMALASGLVPVAFFIAYWVRLSIAAWQASVAAHEDAAFLSALLLYSFLIALNLNEPFMLPWMMATMATVSGTGFLLNVRAIVNRRLHRRSGVAQRPLGSPAHRLSR